MNKLQALLIGSAILFIGMAVHIIIFGPPIWIVVVAGIVGGLYYIFRAWFTLEIPGDLVVFIFEAIIAIVVMYGLLIGSQLF